MARSLQKKTRFDVFKRDEFICQFCGRTPPVVVLEVDHIVPVSKGGSDHIDNLTTACFDCNCGKGATSLDRVPMSVADKASILQEKELQIKAYNKIKKAQKKRVDSEVELICDLYAERYKSINGKSWTLTDYFKTSIERFLDRLAFEEVQAAMVLTCRRIEDPACATKYFCGVCWRTIKGTRR